MRVYFAGPLFTPYEREFIGAAAADLRAAGFDVFVPHEQEEQAGGKTADAIYAVDLEGLLAANAVVALLDGPIVDDGTACEIGIFAARMAFEPEKKGIVGLVTDARRLERAEPAPVNLFVLGCLRANGCVVTSVAEAVAQLERWRGEPVIRSS